MRWRRQLALILAPDLGDVLRHVEDALDSLEHDPPLPEDRTHAVISLCAAIDLLRGAPPQPPPPAPLSHQ